MVNGCSVVGCKFVYSRRKKLGKEGISIHRFPLEKTRREAWIRAVGKENWQPTSASAICSQHFAPEDMDLTGQTRRLRQGAVPTIFPWSSTQTPQIAVPSDIPCRVSEISIQGPVGDCLIGVVYTKKENDGNKSGAPVMTEQSEPTLEEQKLLAELIEKTEELRNARKKIKVLQQKVRREKRKRERDRGIL